MSGGGGGTSQASGPPPQDVVPVDATQLAAFLNTQAGQQYSNVYRPGQTYVNTGSGTGAQVLVYGAQGSDPNANATAMLTAYTNWLAGNTQAQANWQNYANLANLNEGGENDQTITQGAAVSQKNAILGAGAYPTNPPPGGATPGLGSFGSNTVPPAVKLGGAK